MNYIVLDEDPKPDTYIAVFIRREITKKEFSRKEHLKVFKLKEGAIEFAKQLKDKYQVTTIRLFFEEGHSKTLKKSSR